MCSKDVQIVVYLCRNENRKINQVCSLFFLYPGNCPLEPPKSMPRLAEEEEQMLGGSAPPTGPRRTLPPTLPPAPTNLSPEQQKRRHIVASLVHSENNYVATLQRLVNVSNKNRI